MIYPVTWAYGPSTNVLDSEDEMRAQLDDAGFRIVDWINYTGRAIDRLAQAPATPRKLAAHLVFGEDTLERGRNGQRNMIEERIIYWMITAERF